MKRLFSPDRWRAFRRLWFLRRGGLIFPDRWRAAYCLLLAAAALLPCFFLSPAGPGEPEEPMEPVSTPAAYGLPEETAPSSADSPLQPEDAAAAEPRITPPAETGTPASDTDLRLREVPPATAGDLETAELPQG